MPNPNYLSRMLSGVKCQFGFSDFVFKWLKTEYHTKSQRDRQVFLVFDEMKVKESISFDKVNLRFTGFVDYDEFEGKSSSQTRREADHALVFMIRSLNAKLVSLEWNVFIFVHM